MAQKNYEFEMAQLLSEQENLRKKERTLWEIMETLLKSRTIFTDNEEMLKNEGEISMVDREIFKTGVRLSRNSNALAKIEDTLSKQLQPCTEHHVMKRVMLDANDEMVSWVMEGYEVHMKANELSDLGNCLMRLMRQPSSCKISMDQREVVSEISAKLSDEMRNALFDDGAHKQHGFLVVVEVLALSFIYGRNVTRDTEAHIYGRYDSIFQIARYFLKGSDQINAKSGSTWSSVSESIKKKFCPNEETATRKEERVGSTPEENHVSSQLRPSAEIVTPYRDQSSLPNFQFGVEEKFPCFLMEGKKHGHLFLAVDELKKKMERLNERTFRGLPFYISAAITPTEARFMLSEYDRPIKELGKIYCVSTYDGAVEFLLAFLNLLPIFHRFQEILDARQPAWNVDITTSSGVVTPISEKRYIKNNEDVHHFYLEKKVVATHKGVSSWQDLLYVYTTLAGKPIPDSLPTPVKGQNLAEIFTSNACSFTIRVLPVCFPGRAETFLTSYRLIAQCFYDILSALKWLHANDIVHRDVVGRNILKKMCKTGFILIDYECSARSDGKFSVEGRHVSELPMRIQDSEEPDRDKWFPSDDINQLSNFLNKPILPLRHSKQRWSCSFQDLLNHNSSSTAAGKLRRLERTDDTVQATSDILHHIEDCFKKYKSPFE